MSNEVKLVDQVRSSLVRMQPEFKNALDGTGISPEKFTRTIMTAIQKTPEILQCDIRSVYAASMLAAQDGLLPDGREGAIVPRKGIATWVPMTAGLMKKARNSGEISSWSVHVVYINDEFEIEYGDTERFVHRPKILEEPGAIVGAYSIVKMKDGELSREFMTTAEILAIRKRSDGYNYQKSKGGTANPWITDEGEMFKKTVVKRHCKHLPMSTDKDSDLLRVIQRDDERERQEIDITPREAAPLQIDVEPPPKPKRRTALDKVADAAKMVEPEHAEGPPAHAWPAAHALENLPEDDI